jgi:hypothetical protein
VVAHGQHAHHDRDQDEEVEQLRNGLAHRGDDDAQRRLELNGTQQPMNKSDTW